MELSVKNEANFIKFSLPIDFLGRKRHNSCFDKKIKEFICYNQGRYIQFEYLLGLKHRDLKKAVTATTPSPAMIADNCENLLSFIHTELKAVSERNFDLIKKFFGESKNYETPPRVCIKIISEDNKIVTLYRTEKVDFEQAFPIELDRGFSYVQQNGVFFLENDIPQAVKNGSYFTPGLSQRIASAYSRGWWKKKEIDLKWCQCWEDYKGHPSRETSCYRSMVIVPMTLLNCDLSFDFKRNFFKNSPDGDRTIWGFLCMDHVAPNYFDVGIDVNLGYIVADILSLYYISAYIHTAISETAQKVDCLKPMERRQNGHTD